MLTAVQQLVRRTRQHHAIEHATLHVLAAHGPGRAISGYSDPLGFTLFGEIEEDEVRRAVGEALLRLQAGEHGLAIHPNCGTGLLVSGVFATLAGFLAAYSPVRKFDRFVNGVVLVILALILSKPVGLWLQEYTTLAQVADRWVREVRLLGDSVRGERLPGGMRAVRVAFEVLESS